MSALGIVSLRAAFERGETTPSAALEASLAAIEAHRGLNAVTALDHARAVADARASTARFEAGAPISAIDGATIGVKANIAVAGLPWTAAVAAFADRRAASDATVVAALRRAGAVVVGALNMHEAALGATTTSPLYGPCQNPLRPGFTPGGSSGGSAAAVAAGLMAGALGTDTLGSVRIPAAYTGTCGFKPSFGRLSRTGVALLSTSFDHVGVHAAKADDLRPLFEAMSAFDPDDPYSARFPTEPVAPRRLRIGALLTEGVDVSPGVAAAFDRALARFDALGCPVRPVLLEGYAFSRARRSGLLVVEAEGAALMGDALLARPEGFSPGLTALLAYGAGQSAERFAAAQQAAFAARRIARQAFEGIDILVSPTAPQTAFAHGEAAPANQADLTAFANFAGLPAAAVPIGAAEDGLPASLQIIAPFGRDGLALTAAERFAAED